MLTKRALVSRQIVRLFVPGHGDVRISCFWLRTNRRADSGYRHRFSDQRPGMRVLAETQDQFVAFQTLQFSATSRENTPIKKDILEVFHELKRAYERAVLDPDFESSSAGRYRLAILHKDFATALKATPFPAVLSDTEAWECIVKVGDVAAVLGENCYEYLRENLALAEQRRTWNKWIELSLEELWLVQSGTGLDFESR